MVTPNIWGQGQLFAFSAMDGKSLFSDDFTGILCGDKIGIRFFSKVRRELAVTKIAGFVPAFETVSSDLITMNTPGGQMHILYAQAHLIIGNIAAGTDVVMMTEGSCDIEKMDDLELHDTGDGDVTALCKENGRFAFAYGHSREEVRNLAKKGLALPLEELVEKKLCIYRQFSLGEENPYGKLYAKCVSVMKSQLYSPEGRFQTIWSTPDRLPHKRLWLWDSVFHAIGMRNLKGKLAEDLILAVFDTQGENGFIPHMATPDMISRITQPPVIGWGAWLVYEKTGNKDFLRQVYRHNKAFLLWCQGNRRESEEELYSWFTNATRTNRCDESGMDNSSRFDLDTVLGAIDFTCYMANDVRFMMGIAEELEDEAGAAFFGKWYETIKETINEKLWCREDGFYYDYDLRNDRFHKVQSVASFLPLLAGVCSREQAACLAAHLKNPETFGAAVPVPSVSRQDETYGTDMWRGPVWVNYNYMIAEGLRNYGFVCLADELRDKLLAVMNEWYLKTGTVYEFYDGENLQAPGKMNRKGKIYEPYDFTVKMQSIRDYGWSNTLCFDMLHNKYCK